MIGILVRRLLFALGLLGSSLFIAVTLAEGAASGGRSTRLFGQFKELLAAVPTIVGDYLRSAFYWSVCPGVSTGVLFSFGSMVARRDATIGSGTVVGVYSLIGHADIGRNVLLGARVSIMSGKYLHGHPGHRSVGEIDESSRVRIGDNSWIGEGSLVLANVGHDCTVGAGSVVLKDVLDNATVMGNPARKVSLDPVLKGE